MGGGSPGHVQVIAVDRNFVDERNTINGQIHGGKCIGSRIEHLQLAPGTGWCVSREDIVPRPRQVLNGRGWLMVKGGRDALGGVKHELGATPPSGKRVTGGLIVVGRVVKIF